MLHEDQTRRVAQDWKTNPYYDRAEKEDWLETFWGPKVRFRKLFDRLNTRTLVELACGHGRHAARIFERPEFCRAIERMYIMDINHENIDFCKRRFKCNNSVTTVINNGYNFEPLEQESVTAIFCYDAMVHFEYDAVISYVEDAFRILIPGGRTLLHHSNYDKSPGANCYSNPHGRNFMSGNLFAHIAIRAGFEVLEQFVIDWGDFRNLDCISLIEKRRDRITSTESKRSKLSGRILHRAVLRKVKRYFKT